MKQLALTRQVRTFAILVVLSFLLMFVDRIGIVQGVRGGMETVIVPLERWFFRSSGILNRPFEALRFWRSGTQRIADLERQVVELTVDKARLETLEEENASMRTLLGAPLSPQWKFVPAPILSRDDSFSIGAGSLLGVEVGDAVIWENALLGTVFEISARLSTVLALTDPRQSIPVYLPESGADGVVVGRFGTQILLTQVLQSVELTMDEPVITSGAFGPPRGLVVGKIGKITTNETDVYQEAVIEPIIDPFTTQTVFVVKE